MPQESNTQEKRARRRTAAMTLLLTCLPLTVLVGALSAFLFAASLENNSALALDALRNRAQGLVDGAEGARDFVSYQAHRQVFADSLEYMSVDKILFTVPIFAAMRAIQSNADELGIQVRVPSAPSVVPRNPDNTPDRFQTKILQMFKQNPAIAEFDTLVAETATLHYFRPVHLTEDCLSCHGDPARSAEYWGKDFDRGTDILGFRMENMRSGDLKGAFEIIVDTRDVQSGAARAAAPILMFGGGLAALLGLTSLMAVVIMISSGKTREPGA